MKGWTKDEKIMIACCSDSTRPVIFKMNVLTRKWMNLLLLTGNNKNILTFPDGASRLELMLRHLPAVYGAGLRGEVDAELYDLLAGSYERSGVALFFYLFQCDFR